MDFSRAEFEGGSGAALQCRGCGKPIEQQYWTVGAATLCASCAEAVRAGPPSGGGFARALKAFFFGTGAGLLGALGYGAVIFFSGYELALITIGIGWLVGRAVFFGSEQRGGRGYQVLAAVLTYVWCMEAYVPIVASGAMHAEHPMHPVLATVLAIPVSLVLPFTGEMGFLSILILGFGVWRGWREPAARVVTVEGPFDVGAAPVAADAAPAVTS